MMHFECDYMHGAHEKVMEALVKTNMEYAPGYGSDFYCERAKEKIQKACKKPEASVFFLTGGTQTNAIVISSLLRPYEGVIAARTGHVSVHEAGAIEHTGHKVLTLLQHEGKIKAEELEQYLKVFREDENHDHMVFPGMVYLSYPTEYGTLYSKEELEKISVLCKESGVLLYIDGARLGYGLMSEKAELTLEDISSYCDVFYIGGTKVGALCGEAVVFTGIDMPAHFMTMVKQQGALLAKGRLLGVQFDALFTDDLYFKISRHAILMAEKLKQGFLEKGYSLYLDSPTNQQFIILENEKMKQLEEKVSFSFWEKFDENHCVVRFATSWATQEEEVNRLIELL